MTHSCDSLFNSITEKQFVRWAGIPKHCKPADIFRLLGISDTLSLNSTTGRLRKSCMLKVFTPENYIYPIRIWYIDENLIRIDAEYPDVNLTPSFLIENLGEPEAKVDYEFNQVVFAKAEWIYAKKGITAFLNGDGNRVIKVSAYHTTNQENYFNNIWLTSKIREF